jgi:predicted tellurium resistance membrane protein TerC
MLRRARRRAACAFGLIVSVPIIIWGSTLVLKLIDRFPLTVTFGAALLGWIAGGMLVTDVFLTNQFGVPSTAVKIGAEVIGALLVVGLGMLIARRKGGSDNAEQSA